MLRLNLNVISYVAFMWLALASFSANAQSNTCLIHDHHCINHGIGRLVGTVPSDTTSISATANWDQDNDIDLHVLAPAGPSYSAPLEALPGYPLNITAPFFPDVTGAHVYPNHYQSEIDGGVATITHSGDDGQGVATYPDQPGCLNQTGVSCENITVEGAVPGGVYSYALHAFPGTNTAFPPTQYDLEIQANGNLVLVMEEADQGNLTGVMEGTGSQSARIDVFAVNVGHSGHMGGVTLPEYEQYIRPDGMVSYRPAEPDDPSISPYFVQNTIKEQFNARDAYIAELDFLRDQEVERRRRAYLAYLAEQERLRQARLKAELELTLSPYQNQLCNPKYQYCGAPLAPSYTKNHSIQTGYDPEIKEGQVNQYTSFIEIDGERYRYTSEEAPLYMKIWNGTVNIKEYVTKNPRDVIKNNVNTFTSLDTYLGAGKQVVGDTASTINLVKLREDYKLHNIIWRTAINKGDLKTAVIQPFENYQNTQNLIDQTFAPSNDQQKIGANSAQITSLATGVYGVGRQGLSKVDDLIEYSIKKYKTRNKDIDNVIDRQKSYQTYTKENPETGEVYCGRTNGCGTPIENIQNRDVSHHKNQDGFGPAQIDQSSKNSNAIRGREQQLIDAYGGAQSQGGTSGNAINGISPLNPKRDQYFDAARNEFN